MRNAEPELYPVHKRPPRDWFPPLAMRLAAILSWTAIAASIAIIAYGSYNLGGRAPTAVSSPAESTYDHDQIDPPLVEIDDQDLTRLSIKVRNKDRDALLLHIHNAITARGGTIVSALVRHDRTDGSIVLKPAAKHGHAYRIPTDYLPELERLANPDWRDPMAYTQWPQSQTEPLTIATDTTNIVITTQHLLFENRRNQVITMSGTAAILFAFFTALVLSTLATPQNHFP